MNEAEGTEAKRRHRKKKKRKKRGSLAADYDVISCGMKGKTDRYKKVWMCVSS